MALIQAPSSIYRRRRPERTVVYRVLQEHLETWLARNNEADPETGVPRYIERDLKNFLDCGILVRGFARAFCERCGHDFLIAFSCKGPGVCPSCNSRRMVAVAAHLVDHVFPCVPVRQWVISFPKRLMAASGCAGAAPRPARTTTPPWRGLAVEWRVTRVELRGRLPAARFRLLVTRNSSLATGGFGAASSRDTTPRHSSLVALPVGAAPSPRKCPP